MKTLEEQRAYKREYQRKWYKNHPGYYREMTKHAQYRLRDRRKLELVKMLGGRCSLCGYNKSMSALEFDHINPSKKLGNVGTIINTHSFASAKEEAKKCRLLCANCHKEQTWFRPRPDLSVHTIPHPLGIPDILAV